MPEFPDIPASATPVNQIGQNARVQILLRKGLAGLKGADGSKMAENYCLVFYSEATPVYASVDYIILKGGEIFEDLPEAAIYIMSFAASTMADDIVLFDESKKFPDKTTEQWKFYNRAKTEFACCQAMANTLRAVVASRSTRAGRKILADFSIDTGAMSNLLQASRGYLKDLTDECRWWRSVLFAGGAYDHEHPVPQSAVKGGSNVGDSAIGIGRGWYNMYPLNAREATVRQGNSWSRPSKYSHPRYYHTAVGWWDAR